MVAGKGKEVIIGDCGVQHDRLVDEARHEVGVPLSPTPQPHTGRAAARHRVLGSRGHGDRAGSSRIPARRVPGSSIAAAEPDTEVSGVTTAPAAACATFAVSTSATAPAFACTPSAAPDGRQTASTATVEASSSDASSKALVSTIGGGDARAATESRRQPQQLLSRLLHGGHGRLRGVAAGRRQKRGSASLSDSSGRQLLESRGLGWKVFASRTVHVGFVSTAKGSKPSPHPHHHLVVRDHSLPDVTAQRAAPRPHGPSPSSSEHEGGRHVDTQDPVTNIKAFSNTEHITRDSPSTVAG